MSRILILEDDPFIAMDLCALVEESGHEVARVCGSLAEAGGGDVLGHEPGVDFALLDVDVADGKSYPLASRLHARRIPFAFLSGSRQCDVPAHLRAVPFIAKPYAAHTVRGALPPLRRA